MRTDGNRYRGLLALHAATMDEGREVTIRHAGNGFEAVAKAKGKADRTGRGSTLSETLMDLAQKMGIILPPAD